MGARALGVVLHHGEDGFAPVLEQGGDDQDARVARPSRSAHQGRRAGSRPPPRGGTARDGSPAELGGGIQRGPRRAGDRDYGAVLP